jgi:hypothetical protein
MRNCDSVSSSLLRVIAWFPNAFYSLLTLAVSKKLFTDLGYQVFADYHGV